jgi:PrtD family type I secretion system ABC transporter
LNFAVQSALRQANPAAAAVASGRSYVTAVAGFAAVINLLHLGPSLYMLQVYDRVLPSGSISTLAFMSAAAVMCLATLGWLDAVRNRLLVRLGTHVDREISAAVFATLLSPERRRTDWRALTALKDLDTLRLSLSGQAATAVCDAPWAPLFLIVCFLIHPLIGLCVLIGSLAMVIIAWLGEVRNPSRPTLQDAQAVVSMSRLEGDSTHADVLRALGMQGAVMRRAVETRDRYLHKQTENGISAAEFASLSRFIRLVLQAAVLCTGAALVVYHQISAGALIAASILSARALAPLEQIVSGWRQIAMARAAFANLTGLLGDEEVRQPATKLPAPRGHLSLENIGLRGPVGQPAILRGVSLAVEPGQILGIVGTSGAGKSTLARIMTGAQRPDVGIVRIDGASLADWEADDLGPHIGYLPQDLALFAGTVAENICRFANSDPVERSKAVVAAAKAAGAHEMILALPNGYDTPLGAGGRGVSLGQAQRIALARALYGNPAVLVLDEPNAHLDAAGEVALFDALKAAQARGAASIVIAHRAGVLRIADRIAVLGSGTIESLGPRDQIIQQRLTPLRSAAVGE